ncbi:MAG: DNA replication and repair protein RecF [Spirochaetaceae bacterium]|nr:DNA replication and repair protein RecF [Spirochaetaceae bacterium]
MYKRIYTYNFRNLQNGSFNTHNQHIIFTGSNGQGKTNLLEAIYYFSLASSFRERHDVNLVKLGSENKEFATAGYYGDNEEKLLVSWQQGRKQIKINDSPITDRKELLTRFPCLVFAYDDIRLAELEQEQRRRFIDQNLSFIYEGYIGLLREHKKLIKAKNLALKVADTALVKVYNQQLAGYCEEITTTRLGFLENFNQKLQLLLTDIFEEPVTIKLESPFSGLKANEIEVYLNSKLDSELKRATALYGTHRDKYIFTGTYGEVAGFYSTGQKRALSVVLKIASTSLISATLPVKPVMLIDDVFLELDAKLKELMINLMPAYNQAFFTFLPGQNHFSKLTNALVYEVKKGELYVQ